MQQKNSGRPVPAYQDAVNSHGAHEANKDEPKKVRIDFDRHAKAKVASDQMIFH